MDLPESTKAALARRLAYERERNGSAVPAAPSALVEAQRGATLKGSVDLNKQMTRINAGAEYDAEQGQTSPAVLKRNREAMVQSPAPEELTVPQMEWSQMGAQARELGVKPQSLGWGGLKGIGLVDKDNQLRGTLKEMEEFTPADVEGPTWAQQLFGSASKLQRGVVQELQKGHGKTMFHPVLGNVPLGHDPLADARADLMAKQQARRDAVAQSGAMIPPALLQMEMEELGDLERRVTGIRSYAREVGKNAGQAAPEGALGLANAASKALSVLPRAQAMFNEAQAQSADAASKVFNDTPPTAPEKPTPRGGRNQQPNTDVYGGKVDRGVLQTWANEDRTRAAELNQVADQLQEGVQLDMDALPPEERMRVGRLAGGVTGEAVGNVAQTGPTEFSPMAWAAGRAAPVVMDKVVRPAARETAKWTFEHVPGAKAAAEWVSDNPSAWALGPKAAEQADLAAHTSRQSRQLLERQFLEDMGSTYRPFESLTEADKRSILSFERPKSMAGGAVFDTLQEAYKVRHDPALQAQASPAVQDLLTKWTPREVQLAKDVGLTQDVGPYHPLWGQDITKSGGVLQTRGALDRAEEVARQNGGPAVDDMLPRTRDVSPEEFAASPSGVGLLDEGMAQYRQVREPAVEQALANLSAAERALVDTIPESALPGILSRRDMLRRVAQGQGTEADMAELVAARTGTTQRVGDRVARSVEAEGDRARRAVDDVVGKMNRGLDEQAKVAAKGMEGATLAERETLARLDNLARQSSGIAARSAEGQANRLRTDIFKRLQDQRTQAYQADAALRDAGDAHMDQARTTQWKFMEDQKFPDKGRAGAAPHLAEDFPRAMQPAVREAGTKARAAVDDVVNTTQRAINKQRNLAGDNLTDMANAEREALDKMSGTVIRRADSAAERIADVSERAREEIYRRMTQQQYNTGRTLERQADAAEGAMEGARGRQWRFMEGQKVPDEALKDFEPALKAAEDKVMDLLGISKEKVGSGDLAASRQDVVRRFARQMMEAPRESALGQDAANELRAWAGLPPKEFTPAELMEAERYATTVATRGTRGQLKALEAAQELPPSEVTGVRLRTGVPGDEQLDLLKRQVLSGKSVDQGLLEEIEKRQNGMNLFSGAMETAKRSSRTVPPRQFADTFTQDLPLNQLDKPTSYTTLDQYLPKHGLTPADVDPVVMMRDFEGAIKEGRAPQAPQKLLDVLRKNDDVYVIATARGGGPDAMLFQQEAKAMSDALSGKNPGVIHYQAPTKEIAARLNGQVVDRWYAKALVEGQHAAAAQSGHGALANGLNRIFGAARMNYAFTVGRPGFQAKNLFNETSRALADENKLLESVDLMNRIIHAPLRDKTPIPELGMTAGEAHRLAVQLSGAGRGVMAQTTKIADEMPRSFMHDLVAKRSPRAARVLDAPGNIGMAPGLAANKAVDEAFQLSAFGKKLPPGYQGEDGLRLLLAIHKLKRGVAPAEVARQTERALINFAAQNKLQRSAKFVVPFAKYYTGSLTGAAYLTAKNPNQLRWLNRYVEANQAYDRGTHDQQALSPRLRTEGEALGFQPMVRDESGQVRTYMLDNVPNEAGQLFDTFRTGLTPEPGERGLAAVAGPWITDSATQVTGQQPGTGRWAVPFSDENQARAAQLNAMERWGPLARANMPLAMALELIEHPKQYRTDPLSDSGKAALAFYALRYTPVLSQVGAQPLVAALTKWAAGVRGNNPASATEEARGEEIARTLTRWATGAGITPVDPVKRQAAEAKRARKQMIETPSMIEKRLIKSGRASEE